MSYEQNRSARQKVENTRTYALHILSHMRNFVLCYNAVLDDVLAVQIAQDDLTTEQRDVLTSMNQWIAAHEPTIETYLTTLGFDVNNG